MNLKDIAISVYMACANDTELLKLLDIPSPYSLADAREQIIDDRYPNDLVTDNKSKICIYESPTVPGHNILFEKGYWNTDIYVHKDKDIVDRRSILIAERLIYLLDVNKRKLRGLQPISTGVGLFYYNRIPNMPIDNEDWKRYGLIFTYDYIK